VKHSRPFVIALIAGVLIGALVAVQARINGAFAADLGDPVVAAALGFVLGWLVLTIVMLTGRQHREAVRSLPDLVRGRALPWWALIGGLGGATLVATQGLAVPELGVALFTVALVAGQTASSLEVDRLGLGPAGKMHPSRMRIVSAVIALAAVIIAVEPWSSGASDLSLFVLFMCLFAGTAVSAQQAFNGRVSQASGSPIAAAWVNFSVGGIMLWTLSLIRGVDLSLAPSPVEQPWLWTGGLLGSVFVVVAAAIVRTLGVLLLTLTTIAGQLFGAVIIDVVVPTPGRPITGFSLVGVALTFVAVLVGSGLLRRQRKQVG
jgi:transporter family-2 protein